MLKVVLKYTNNLYGSKESNSIQVLETSSDELIYVLKE